MRGTWCHDQQPRQHEEETQRAIAGKVVDHRTTKVIARTWGNRCGQNTQPHH